jgi:hypothetical protein
MPVPLAREIAANIDQRTSGWLRDVALACVNELWKRALSVVH